MVRKWIITYTYKRDVLGLQPTSWLTIDPNFQQDIQVQEYAVFNIAPGW